MTLRNFLSRNLQMLLTEVRRPPIRQAEDPGQYRERIDQATPFFALTACFELTYHDIQCDIWNTPLPTVGYIQDTMISQCLYFARHSPAREPVIAEQQFIYVPQCTLQDKLHAIYGIFDDYVLLPNHCTRLRAIYTCLYRAEGKVLRGSQLENIKGKS